MLHPEIIVSIMTEFVENTDGGEAGKQDCERKACWRLMERLEKEFPRLNLCICADRLYACGRFFQECADKNWKYILRFKEGSIPTAAEGYEKLRKITGNGWEKTLGNGKAWYDYVEGIEHNGYKTSLVEYTEERQIIYKKGVQKGRRRKVEKSFLFLTNLSISRKNVPGLVEYGRMRWKIENEGFNTQKRQGYHLEHQFSRDCQAQKCHYYLIQIGHMAAQVLEAWEVEKCKAEQRAET